MALNFRETPEKIRVAASERMHALANIRPVRVVVERTQAFGRRESNRIARLTAPARIIARAWFSKREPREKALLKVFGVVLGIIILYSFVYVPISGLDLGFGDQMATRQKQLAQVRSMMHTYGRLKTQLAATEKRTVPSKDFSLFSVIEQSLTKSVGRDKIGSITPSDRSVPGGFQQYTIDLKLAGLNLQQIVDVLYGVQTLPMPVTVSNLHVRKDNANTHSYDVDMTCMALGRNG
jgi:Type II secretion system (T2SS), protein M